MNKYPKAIGPYSAYRICGDIVYLSGQLPIDPKVGEIVSEDIKSQTRQSLKNIEEILKELNLDFSNILKTTVFLSDISDFDDMNATYAEFFKAPFPARSAFAVKSLPKNSKIEVEVIATNKKG